jgi:hypothetical protein
MSETNLNFRFELDQVDDIRASIALDGLGIFVLCCDRRFKSE